VSLLRRLRAERAERHHQQLQHQPPPQSLQGDLLRQVEALQQQLMFAQEEVSSGPVHPSLGASSLSCKVLNTNSLPSHTQMAGNRRRANERESRLSETQGKIGTLERDLRRREEQLVQLEEELRLARERCGSYSPENQGLDA
jgi:hypothetical protein